MTRHVTLVAQYVTDVFYIFNSTVVDWTCLFFSWVSSIYAGKCWVSILSYNTTASFRTCSNWWFSNHITIR